MARAIWSGVIAFGLVSVPVQLFSATGSHTIRFHQLERGTGDRVRNRRVNERTGKNVDNDDIVKGYDMGGGEYVVVEQKELDEVAPGKSRSIDITGFVDLDAVDSVYFDRTYYVGPKGDQHDKVYELLRTALANERKIGIATFVMRGKQYLVALHAQADALVLHTLHWADEVRDPEKELPELPDHRLAEGKELQTAEQLIEAQSMPWRPEDFEDTYAEKVQELVEAKRNGEEIVVEAGPPEPTNVVDLTEALQQSVDRARSGNGSRSGKKRSSQASGRGREKRQKAPSGRGLAELTKKELYERATAQEVPGRSTMSRDQLVKALTGSGDTAAKAS